jgi:DNA modification methylase
MVGVINQHQGKNWVLYHGDSIEVLKGIPDNSIHYTVTSPPFSSLYTYSASDRDMGNSKDDSEFFTHFQFLVKELYRVTVPGRLISLHCMNIPIMKQKAGYIGIQDFRGDLIRAFQAEGWIFHSEVCIWKDPVTAMQRTKALGLLHKQVCKDSSMSRQGIPDYLVTMRKRGDNPEPISGEFQYYVGEDTLPKGGKQKDSINIWQRYASPVWMDINPSNTLQYQSARDNDDERHVAPLQLQVIERGLQLWSNPGDICLDPFNGIGSTGYTAIKAGRKYVGVELKESYYNAAVNNIQNAEPRQQTLFDLDMVA